MSEAPTILIVDDDPSHLKLYAWIVARAGFRTATALVGSTSVALPNNPAVSAVLLDYRLASALTAKDVAILLKNKYPQASIVLLSDVAWMPDEMVGHAVQLVHKGEPEVLIQTLHTLIPGTTENAAK